MKCCVHRAIFRIWSLSFRSTPPGCSIMRVSATGLTFQWLVHRCQHALPPPNFTCPLPTGLTFTFGSLSCTSSWCFTGARIAPFPALAWGGFRGSDRALPCFSQAYSGVPVGFLGHRTPLRELRIVYHYVASLKCLLSLPAPHPLP